MPEYRNPGPYRRVWPHLTVGGRTVELDPGETVVLDVEIDDPWLTPVEAPAGPAPKPAKPAKTPAAVPPAPTPAAAAPAVPAAPEPDPAPPAESKE